MLAGTFEGSNVSLPGPPTTTVCVAAVAAPVVVAGWVAVPVAVVAVGTADVDAAPPVAAALNASNWVPGVTAKTIPA